MGVGGYGSAPHPTHAHTHRVGANAEAVGGRRLACGGEGMEEVEVMISQTAPSQTEGKSKKTHFCH